MVGEERLSKVADAQEHVELGAQPHGPQNEEGPVRT
jgi:hypothetical protein